VSGFGVDLQQRHVREGEERDPHCPYQSEHAVGAQHELGPGVQVSSLGFRV